MCGVASSERQPQRAISYYESARNLSDTKILEFQAQMHLIDVLKKSLEIQLAKNNTASSTKLKNEVRSNDARLMQIWNQLETKDKYLMTVQFKPMLEQNLSDTETIKSQSKILLWAWKNSISQGQESSPKDWKANYQTTDDTVFLLSKLSKQFLKIGDQKSFKDTKALLRDINPDSFKTPDAEKLWAQELTELAEIHRENNEYLDAGRIYALTGEKSKNWDKRAEALYKGGLLLYRSGRREEAVQAFEQAANDGNNLLYAELAKKRLEQLKE